MSKVEGQSASTDGIDDFKSPAGEARRFSAEGLLMRIEPFNRLMCIVLTAVSFLALGATSFSYIHSWMQDKDPIVKATLVANSLEHPTVAVENVGQDVAFVDSMTCSVVLGEEHGEVYYYSSPHAIVGSGALVLQQFVREKAKSWQGVRPTGDDVCFMGYTTKDARGFGVTVESPIALLILTTVPPSSR